MDISPSTAPADSIPPSATGQRSTLSSSNYQPGVSKFSQYITRQQIPFEGPNCPLIWRRPHLHTSTGTVNRYRIGASKSSFEYKIKSENLVRPKASENCCLPPSFVRGLGGGTSWAEHPRQIGPPLNRIYALFNYDTPSPATPRRSQPRPKFNTRLILFHLLPSNYNFAGHPPPRLQLVFPFTVH